MTGAPPDDSGSTGDRLLPWGKVRDLTGISRTTAWRLQNTGAFPRPVVISRGRVGWRESEVYAWKAALTPRGTAPRQAPLFDSGPSDASPAPSAGQPQAAPGKPRRRGARQDRAHADQMSFDF